MTDKEICRRLWDAGFCGAQSAENGPVMKEFHNIIEELMQDERDNTAMLFEALENLRIQFKKVAGARTLSTLEIGAYDKAGDVLDSTQGPYKDLRTFYVILPQTEYETLRVRVQKPDDVLESLIVPVRERV